MEVRPPSQWPPVRGVLCTRSQPAPTLTPPPHPPTHTRAKACEKYESALSHQPASHAALYNWGVALTDLARCVRDRPGQARSCLNLASRKYAEALTHQPGSVQALNNWGLVLQVGWGGGGAALARRLPLASRAGSTARCEGSQGGATQPFWGGGGLMSDRAQNGTSEVAP